jgi:hypothetical protein
MYKWFFLLTMMRTVTSPIYKSKLWKLPLKYELNVTVAIVHLVHIMKWNIVLVTRKYVLCEDCSAIVRVYTSNKNDKEYMHGSMYLWRFFS